MGGSRAEWTGLGSVQEVGGEREGEEFVRMKRKRTPREWEHAAGTGSDWPVRASAREKGDKRVDGHSNNNRIIISKRLHTARSHSSTVCVSGLLRTCAKMFLPTADEWSSTHHLAGCLNELLCFGSAGNIGLFHFEEQSSHCEKQQTV